MAFVLTCLIAIISAALALPDSITPDSQQYQLIAQGDWREVLKPFAPRVLHPLLARAMATLISATITQAFWLIAPIALFVFLFGLLSLSYRSDPFLAKHKIQRIVNSPPSQGGARGGFDWTSLIFISPLLLMAFRSVYIHDVVYAAIFVTFLYALQRRWFVAALALLALLHLTRESTYLLSSILIVTALIKRERALALGVLCVGVIGVIVSSTIARDQPSLHAMNDLLYTLTRMPINLLWNVLGVPLLSNTAIEYWRATNPHVLAFCELNSTTLTLPAWLPFGKVSAVRVCAWQPQIPLTTFTWLLSGFGVLPAYFFATIKNTPRTQFAQQPLWLIAAVVHGLIAFALAPLLGNTVFRYVFYAWSAFWLFQNFVGSKSILRSPVSISLHLAATWLPFLLIYFLPDQVWSAALACVIALALNLITYNQARKWREF
jgi:hypothetical protein